MRVEPSRIGSSSGVISTSIGSSGDVEEEVGTEKSRVRERHCSAEVGGNQRPLIPISTTYIHSSLALLFESRTGRNKTYLLQNSFQTTQICPQFFHLPSFPLSFLLERLSSPFEQLESLSNFIPSPHFLSVRSIRLARDERSGEDEEE